MLHNDALPDTMCAMITMGHGGLDQIVWHTDWPCPRPAPGQVMISCSCMWIE